MKEEVQEIYNPFNTKDYIISNRDSKRYFQYKDLSLEICKGGYIPKSGLLYDMILNEKICSGSEVLDLGCGYLGILGIISYANKRKYKIFN